MLFRRLKNYGFKIGPRKCKFFHEQLLFLRYEITPMGVSPERDRLIHLKKMEYPTTVTEIRSFLGFGIFFYRLIHNFGLCASQLTKLTRKNSTWKGGELPPETKGAFHSLNDYILSSPTLHNPDPNKDLYLYTDESK